MACVLVVEDNALNRALLRDILEYAGHTVVEASGVDDGWGALQGEPPALVLLDILIPGGGGEHLLGRIRSTPRTAALRVVAVTALAMPGDRERLLSAGFDAYVSKPYDTAALADLVERLLSES